MAKDSRRATAGELQKIVESRGQKTLKEIVKQPLHHHKKYPSSSKNKFQHIQLSDTTGTSNGTGFYGQMKLKNELFSSKHSKMGLVNVMYWNYWGCFQ